MNYKSNKPGGSKRHTSRTRSANKAQKNRTQKAKVKRTSLKDIFRSGEYRGGFKSFGWPFVFGLLLITIGLFLFGAFISYITSGAEDQSLLLEGGTHHAEEVASQMGGKFGIHGSTLMQKLINGWLGLGMLFLFYLIPLKGISLLLQRKIPFVQQTIICTVSAFWLSATLALMPDSWTAGWFFLPGGVFGEIMVKWMIMYIGVMGTILVLLLVLALLLYFSFASVRDRYKTFALNQREKDLNPSEEMPAADEEYREEPDEEESTDEEVYEEEEETNEETVVFVSDEEIVESSEEDQSDVEDGIEMTVEVDHEPARTGIAPSPRQIRQLYFPSSRSHFPLFPVRKCLYIYMYITVLVYVHYCTRIYTLLYIYMYKHFSPLLSHFFLRRGAYIPDELDAFSSSIRSLWLPAPILPEVWSES